ncbi:MAG: hypothetical protein MUC96_02820 [Myxococcaceae bacterium]|jgi:anti-sigma factor RsiW|nr:hypothetical protein [Myxococcaceae bacterium]
MTCDEARAELIGFQLAVLDDPRRGELERHLTACPACVAELLSLKRDVERPAPPPASLRASVRQAVAREMGLVARPPPWWERPLAFGLGLAAVVVALTTVQLVATGQPRAPVGLGRGGAP